jgi:cytochrome c oxidase subunit II
MSVGKIGSAFLGALATMAGVNAFAGYGDVNMLPPGSPVAAEVYDLHIFVLWICFFIFIVVFGAMFYSIWKHRKAAGHAAEHFHENTTVEIIWTIVPFVIILFMAVPATRVVLAQKDTGGEDMTIKVTAYQWRWEYDYMKEGVKYVSVLSTPYEQIYEAQAKAEHYLTEVDRPLVVPAGKRIRILVTANDVIHGFYVQQLGINQYGIPGFIKDTWFQAKAPGTYRGFCSQICGKEHAYMPIVVEAKTQEEYDAWIKEQKANQAKTASAQ